MMIEEHSVRSGYQEARVRWFPLLLLLFIGSGTAALIYEIVWLQLLELVIGSSAVSIGVLLGTFMGGMCLGSLLLPRIVSARHHPLRVYAVLEFGIGIFGILLQFVIPLVGRLYTTWGGYGLGGFLLRGLVASVCLLPPTLAMGATLPAVARWIDTTPKGFSWVGFFYAGNIAGAVLGSLLAGFYLLRVYDMATATYAAAALNWAVATLGFAIASRTPSGPVHELSDERQAVFERLSANPGSDPSAFSARSGPRLSASNPPASSGRGPSGHPSAGAAPGTPSGHPSAGAAPGTPSGNAIVYGAIALSGFCALAAEVIWTRLLALLLGATVYAFSIILAVFLIGLGIGSTIGSALARSLSRPRLAVGWCQLLVVGTIAWTAYMLTESLPYWPIDPSIAAQEVLVTFQIDFLRALWAILPSPILWGASFPLALAALATKGQDAGRLVGGIYAANTVGAIFGALGASLLLVAWIGSQQAQQTMMWLSALTGALVLGPEVFGARSGRPALRWIRVATLVIGLGLAGLATTSVSPVPGLLVAHGRYAATWRGQAGDIFYVGEGLNSSVAVSRMPDGVLSYHNAGKVQASSQPFDMRLQRMLGHFTTLVPSSPRAVLVIGGGAGITAGAVSIDPKVESVRIAEIEPLVSRVVSTYFGEHNFDVIKNPKVHVTIDDARHYLLTTKEKFDAITTDPLDAWVKGAATLHTKEFFELAKEHLNPGGTVTVWAELYESTSAAVKSAVGTFFEVFPNGTIWGNTREGKGYDTVLLGQVQPTRINLDEVEARLQRPEYARVAKSLGEIGISSAVDLFATYAGRASDMTGWLQDAQINRDRNLRLEYLAGLGVNLYHNDRIYADILRYRRFPEDLFTGSEGLRRSLRDAIERAPGGEL